MIIIMRDSFMYTGKTFTAEELKDRAAKALKINGFDFDDNNIPPPAGAIKISDNTILYPIENKVKPTIRIKRAKPDYPIRYLKGASVIQDKRKREREKAEKALKLNISDSFRWSILS
jgi:hypothetical protein